MYIDDVYISEATEEKLARKHNVSVYEAYEIFDNQPWIRWAEKGHTPGEDAYSAFGCTNAGRYLIVFFLHKKDRQAVVISARDMNQKERHLYERR